MRRANARNSSGPRSWSRKKTTRCRSQARRTSAMISSLGPFARSTPNTSAPIAPASGTTSMVRYASLPTTQSFPQVDFAHLARSGAGEVGDAPQFLGPLLPRDARTREMFGNRREVERVDTVREPHERARVLAQPVVGRGDDRDLGDLRQRRDRAFDLRRREVLAAADDDVLQTVGDREE